MGRELLVAGDLVADRVDGDVNPPGDLEGLFGRRLAVVLDPVREQEEGPLLVLGPGRELGRHCHGVVEGGLAVGLGLVEGLEELRLVRRMLGGDLDLAVGEEEKGDLVPGPEEPGGQVAEGGLAFLELVLEGHAAADVEQDGQAERRPEIVHKVGDRLLLVVLVDREVFLEEVVDEPPLGILDGDGQGDGPDDVFVGDLVLDLLLGEGHPGRPDGGQRGKDDHNQDFAFHGSLEGLASMIPCPLWFCRMDGPT